MRADKEAGIGGCDLGMAVMLRLGFLAALLWVCVDQAAKWWMLEYVMQPPRVIPVTGFFNLVLGRNPGVSFGLFGSAPPWALTMVTLAMVAALILWIIRCSTRLTAAGLGLAVGGAFGNMADRLRHGAVTDFLDFYVGDWHWPAFNLADVGIVCGLGLVVLADALTPKARSDTAHERSPDISQSESDQKSSL